MSRGASRLRFVTKIFGEGFLFLVTCLSLLAVFFIFLFIARDAIPFLLYQPDKGNILLSVTTEDGVVPVRSLQDFKELAAKYGDCGDDVRLKVRLFRHETDDVRVEELRAEIITSMREALTAAQNGKLAEMPDQARGVLGFGVRKAGWLARLSSMTSGRLVQNGAAAKRALEALSLDNVQTRAPEAIEAIESLQKIGKVDPRVYTYFGAMGPEQGGEVVCEKLTVRPLDEKLARRFFQADLSLLRDFLEFPEGSTPVVVTSAATFDWCLIRDFFTGKEWRPAKEPGSFGSAPIFFGSLIVTIGSILVAVPLGVAAAVCLSDILPFEVRQYVKPVIEILAAIPSVAYGFFAVVVFGQILKDYNGKILAGGLWLVCVPLAVLVTVVVADILADKVSAKGKASMIRALTYLFMGGGLLGLLLWGGLTLWGIDIDRGENALNVSIILGIMALPTVVSVSEDALQAVGRDLRAGSYALGATRAETVIKTVIPAAISGIIAAIILGIMRAIGETMVVWMASGNASEFPEPWYNVLKGVSTLTATIARDMGEADHISGAARFHVLFLLALCLLTISFCMNLASEWVVRLQRKKLGK